MSTTTTLRAPFTVQRVVDTRDYVEQDDRLVAVPGSGDLRDCDRCGRPHEVHAYVTDSTGRPGVVGTGCVEATDQPAVRRLAAAARTAARKAAAYRLAEQAAEELATARRSSLFTHPFDPAAIERTAEAGRHFWTHDDAQVRGTVHHDDAERVACLQDVWERKRLADAVGGPDALHALQRRAAR